MATYLLDTSVFSQPIKDKPDTRVLERWSLVGEGAVCTSAISVAEVLQGLESRASAKYWRRYRELLEHHYDVLPFDAAAAAVFARLGADLREAGTPKPALDLMIAAIAKHHGLVVVTLNLRDFNGIPGVAVEDWSGV